MSFQWVFNNAETLSINRLDNVGSTQSRDGTVKAVNRGTPKKIFTVKLPNGPRWSVIRTDIVAAEALDRYTTAAITIPYASFPWYYGNVNPGGSAESYTVICVQFPQWTIFARDQVSWDGPFVFVEV
jgi:hypothetical protein